MVCSSLGSRIFGALYARLAFKYKDDCQRANVPSAFSRVSAVLLFIVMLFLRVYA
jgi:hypothetical protein